MSKLGIRVFGTREITPFFQSWGTLQFERHTLKKAVSAGTTLLLFALRVSYVTLSLPEDFLEGRFFIAVCTSVVVMGSGVSCQSGGRGVATAAFLTEVGVHFFRVDLTQRVRNFLSVVFYYFYSMLLICWLQVCKRVSVNYFSFFLFIMCCLFS